MQLTSISLVAPTVLLFITKLSTVFSNLMLIKLLFITHFFMVWPSDGVILIDVRTVSTCFIGFCQVRYIYNNTCEKGFDVRGHIKI